jgi:hypothetical protein
MKPRIAVADLGWIAQRTNLPPVRITGATVRMTLGEVKHRTDISIEDRIRIAEALVEGHAKNHADERLIRSFIEAQERKLATPAEPRIEHAINAHRNRTSPITLHRAQHILLEVADNPRASALAKAAWAERFLRTPSGKKLNDDARAYFEQFIEEQRAMPFLERLAAIAGDDSKSPAERAAAGTLGEMFEPWMEPHGEHILQAFESIHRRNEKDPHSNGIALHAFRWIDMQIGGKSEATAKAEAGADAMYPFDVQSAIRLGALNAVIRHIDPEGYAIAHRNKHAELEALRRLAHAH